MGFERFSMNMEDGKKIACYQWLPETGAQPKAAVQIAHGMAEHSKRYDRFARFLSASGYAVYANDHRGHGETAGSPENLGCFADNDGWHLVVEDMYQLTGYIKKIYSEIPVFLFGHSMGSFLSRNYIFLHGRQIKGAILSGTGGNPGLLGDVGRFVAKLESKIKGKKTPSPLLTKLSFGKFNDSFKPNRTDYDWLSRDEDEVDKYVNDPFCGTVFSSGFFYDLLTGVKIINRHDNIKKIAQNLPIYLFSGDKDPVGDNRKGVEQVYQTYKTAGIKDVTVKFYEDGRHEMLNEINREDVYKDVAGWIDSHV